MNAVTPLAHEDEREMDTKHTVFETPSVGLLLRFTSECRFAAKGLWEMVEK